MIHGLASLLGAFLLFYLQPLIGKALTPWFGGGAAVWVTCLVFFQIVLLAGYAYAHALATRVPIGRQGWIHGAVGAAALAVLAWTTSQGGAPFLPPPGWAPQGGSQPVLQLLASLAGSAGLPIFFLSATSPLVQRWFALRHPDRRPYRLYALSNAGSFAGLLLFPFVAEPLLSERFQAWIGSALLLVQVLVMVRAGRMAGAAPAGGPERPPATPVRTWLEWIFLAALGTTLLTAGSNLLSWQVATIPLLWALPLAVYLLTFILAFERDLDLNRRHLGPGLAVLLAAMMLCIPWLVEGFWLKTMAVLLVLCVFAGCMVAHGRLSALKPEPRRLTSFYLAISLGGVLGGLGAGILAPLLLHRVYEFYLAAAVLGGTVVVGFRTRIGRTAGTLLFAAAAWMLVHEAGTGGFPYRDFYGVVLIGEPAPGIRLMTSGQTLHGIELLSSPLEPLAYFGPESGIGRAMASQRARKGKLRIGILGLGVGNSVGYARAGDRVTVYEISPKVIRLAGTVHPTHFNVLTSSPAPVELVEGDGRLSMERELARSGSKGFDVLLIDAFSGGNIPWHLLTREAMDLYLGHLAEDGVLAFHVSNHLRVDSLVLALARDMDLASAQIVRRVPPIADPQYFPLERSSNYVLFSRKGATLGDPTILGSALHVWMPKGSPELRDPVLREGQARTAEWIRGVSSWRDDRNSLSTLLWLK